MITIYFLNEMFLQMCKSGGFFFSEQWKMEASEEFFRHKIFDYNTQTSLVCQGNLDADPGHKLSL